jgi:hypothetical protein
MMNRKAGHNGVERAEDRERELQIVTNDFSTRHRSKSGMQPVEHGRRKIEGNTVRVRPLAQDKFQQPFIPGAEIEDPPNTARDFVEQHMLTGGPVGHSVGPLEVGGRVLG